MAVSQAIERLSRPTPVSVQGPPGRPAPPGGYSLGCGSFRGASPALCWPEAGRESYIPKSTSGVFGFGPAACSCSDSRPEPPAPPGSRSSTRFALPGSCPARSRPVLRSLEFTAAPLAGFSLDPRLTLSVAATHRVRGACHVIVAPFVVVAADLDEVLVLERPGEAVGIFEQVSGGLVADLLGHEVQHDHNRSSATACSMCSAVTVRAPFAAAAVSA